MPRRSLAISSVLCAAALAPGAAPAAASTPSPSISSVRPMRLAIGQKLALRGHNFRSGSGRNVVVFQRSGGRAVFVRAGRSTHTSLVVTIPSKIRTSLTLRSGAPVATRFHLNVLAQRFGAHFTSNRLSPVITNSEFGSGPGPVGRCNPAAAGDSDHDQLPNDLERQLHTDPCLADTDGDSVPDGYEYRSALDLNQQPITHFYFDSSHLPYPGKRPYPNPLDPSDANHDHDGDGLTLADEFHATAKFGAGTRLDDTSGPLYSDGTQTSHGDQSLTDDRRDVDGDGLPNWVEAHGPGQATWWKLAYKDEPTYDLRAFSAPDWLDADTDGDGLKDGADDSDHDGWSDVYETGLGTVKDPRSISTYWVQPFNPCLPDPTSATCSLHPPFDDPWEPFKSGWNSPVWSLNGSGEQPAFRWPRCPSNKIWPESDTVHCPPPAPATP
jgi:hypothetical protein